MNETSNSEPEIPDFEEVPEGDEGQVSQANQESREEQLAAQLADAETKALRYQADLDNFRRRARREADEQLKYAALPLVGELLDVLDNLNRAIEATESNEAGENLSQGVKMVAQQLQDLLQRNGCKKIEAEGQPFDPNLHQAVQMVASPTVPANHVAQEFRAGFRLHDRVIRPAQVQVSTGPEGS